MYNIMDSQPQEWLNNNPNQIHTLCVCSFVNRDSTVFWTNELVPKNKNGIPFKWSCKSGSKRNLKIRSYFIERVKSAKSRINFKVHCISSSESQISNFANYFYLQNIKQIKQENDEKGRNCLVFNMGDRSPIKMPALRAANLIWIVFCIKYLKEQEGLSGFILSDWFCNDNMESEDPAVGVSIVNYFLKCLKIDLQISITKLGTVTYDDILSDWFSGWCNTVKSKVACKYQVEEFEKLEDEDPKIIDWIEFNCNYTIEII